MLPSLSELKVLPSFCFAFKIPDDVTASNIYSNMSIMVIWVVEFSIGGQACRRVMAVWIVGISNVVYKMRKIFA